MSSDFGFWNEKISTKHSNKPNFETFSQFKGALKNVKRSFTFLLK